MATTLARSKKPRAAVGILAAIALGALVLLALSTDAPELEHEESILGAWQRRRRLRNDPRTVQPRRHRPRAESAPSNSNRDLVITAGDESEMQHGTRPLIHVFNPYRNEDTGKFAPLDFEQWTMFESILDARDAYHRYADGHTQVHELAYDSIIVVCAILDIDVEALEEVASTYCDNVVTLTRSAATEYPALGLKPVTFVQDIVDAGVSVAQEVTNGSNDYHLMLTNSDICLTKNFFQEMEIELVRLDAQALSVNRKLVMEHVDQLPMAHLAHVGPGATAKLFLAEAEKEINARRFRKHPGYDCFVLRSSLVESVNFGDMYVGVPWWGGNTDLMLKIMASNYVNLPSSHFATGGTFHFGDAKGWQPHSLNVAHPRRDQMAFWAKFDREELMYLPWCPMLCYPPFNELVMQNVINCGKWFKPPASRTTDDGGDDSAAAAAAGSGSDVSRVPAFVNAGYEDVYLQRFRKVLRYTEEGYPASDRYKFGPYASIGWVESFAPVVS